MIIIISASSGSSFKSGILRRITWGSITLVLGLLTERGRCGWLEWILMWPHKALFLENCFPQATEECGGGGGCWFPRTLRTLPSWMTWGLLPPATSSLRPPLFGLWIWECCCWEKKSLWLFNSMAEKWKRGTSSLFFEEERKLGVFVWQTAQRGNDWLCIYRGSRHSTMHGYLWEKMMVHEWSVENWKLIMRVTHTDHWRAWSRLHGGPLRVTTRGCRLGLGHCDHVQFFEYCINCNCIGLIW